MEIPDIKTNFVLIIIMSVFKEMKDLSVFWRAIESLKLGFTLLVQRGCAPKAITLASCDEAVVFITRNKIDRFRYAIAFKKRIS